MRNPTTLLLATLFAAIAFAPIQLQAQSAADPDSPEIAKVRTIESNWANALVKKDQYALDLALSPNYVDISATGEVTTKDQQIARLFSQNYPLTAYNETITSIRVLGDTAIAQGTYTLRRKWGDAMQEDRGIFTHVYQRTRTSWQCINGQRTIVREQVAAPRKTEKAGELPFHIPFTGKKKEDDQPAVTVVQPKTAPPAPAPAPDATPTPEQAGPPTLQDVK
jgi:ketosteroid isomerase-like protein